MHFEPKEEHQENDGKFGFLSWLSLGLLITIVVVWGTFYFVFQFPKTELFTESSPNGTHKLEFFEKGTPFFAGESKIQIKYNGKRINIPIANDGRNLAERNVYVLWKDEDHAIIHLSGDNQDTEIIEFHADEWKKFITKETEN